MRAPGVVVSARYRLVRPLGVGGMGTVWLADDLLLDSPCALKLIDDDKAQSTEVRVRFAREAKVAAQLRGAHVVDVFEHGEWEGTPFIAMEYLHGEDLGTRLDREKVLDPAMTYRIAAHVARALARAHAFGIVHRDLKPENVFLVQGDDGEVAKVVDFGIAKHDAYSLRDKTTKTGSFLGTPFYVSPEQARGKPTDHRSDLWSLAVIVFQCMTGRPPFESEALGELMGLILYEDLPKPSLVRPGVSEAFDAWWERAAKRDRDERFQSAREFADALGEALGQTVNIAVPSLSPRTSLMIEGTGEPILEELRETDAPLSRTRHSSVPRASIATALIRNPRHWRAAMRNVSRKVLVGGAVAFGLLVGGAATLLLPDTPAPTIVLPPPTPAAAAPTAEPLPRPTVEVVGPATTAATPTPAAVSDAEPEPSTSAKSTSVKESSTKGSSAAPRRVPRTAPKKAPTVRRDYGI
ncbi:MAG TPA: serine/threonine-protein kinase [Polyangiaceae bacterium]|nr:serine/threonine-protein kinase [Polyangiaceae bacterium]